MPEAGLAIVDRLDGAGASGARVGDEVLALTDGSVEEAERLTARTRRRRMSATAVVLFTHDLRVHDQPALRAATDAGGEAVPLFVLDDAIAGAGAGVNRRVFLRDALVDLRESLRQLGGDLVVRRGDPVDEALRIAHATAAETIVIGDDASGYAQRRRRRLERACDRERLALRVEDTVGAVPPGEPAPTDRDHYRRFTPYWRRWRDTPLPAPLDPPTRIELPPGLVPRVVGPTRYPEPIVDPAHVARRLRARRERRASRA